MGAETALLVDSVGFYSDERLTAGFTRYPVTPGHVVIEIRNTRSFAAEDLELFLDVMLTVRHVSECLSAVLAVHRCALVFDGAACISLIPLHGLGKDWKPVTWETLEYHETYPGYITSKNGPKLKDADLHAIRQIITASSGLLEPDLTFHGPTSDQNLFARIIRGDLPSWKVWESRPHVAFLTPFANTPGFTVLVPRKHLSSDIFSLNDQEYTEILRAAYSCAEVLRKSFQVSRCGFIFEGYEVDYAHVKLIPIHEHLDHKKISDNDPQYAEFQETYQGYVTSQPGPLLSDPGTIVSTAHAMRVALRYEERHPPGP